jgi:geranylgeranyl pyrophosphate synthase
MQARRRLAELPPAPLSRLLADELAPQALAALVPEAGPLPGRLWAAALIDPVMELLGRRGKEFRARLTSLAFALAGGRDEPPALGAMLEIIHAGSMIVDDIEDDSPERRGGPSLHLMFGLPLALNAGNWMYFFPLELAGRLGLAAEVELALRRRMSRTMLDCHYGQALDLAARLGQVPPQRLRDVALTTSTLKTGRLVRLAAEAGALVGGGDGRTVETLGTFGEALGVGLQMLDDLGNLSGETAPGKRFEDLRGGRVTWAWAWAADRLDQRAFRALEEEGMAVARGEREADGLAAALRLAVGAEGRLRAHGWLQRALQPVRAAFAGAPALEALERELARLEASYG